MTTTDAGPTTADLATSITRSLATIRKAWPHLNDPPRPAGVTRRPAPGSRIPVALDPLSLRVEIARDLAFWVHVIADEDPTVVPPAKRQVPVPTTTPNTTWISVDAPGTVDVLHTLRVLQLIADRARWLSGRTYANRLAAELEDHAHDARNLAWPRNRDTILLGACTNTIGVDGTPTVCATPVRASIANPSDVKCRGCGLTDTVDGWILRIVGHEGLVTIPQLVPILRRRMGLSVSERTLRRWYREGRIAATGGTDVTPLFDRRTVFAALTRREQLLREAAS